MTKVAKGFAGCFLVLLHLCFEAHAETQVSVWGYNWYVNGGPSQFVRATAPPGNLTNVVSVAGGAGHDLALRNNGTVSAWGDNSLGQSRIPAGLTNVTAIAAGTWNSLALTEEGKVVAWGDNTYGQTNVPPDVTNVVAIAAGLWHDLALRRDGTVVAWGGNSVNQAKVPSGLTEVVQIAAGENHSLALKADGTVAIWGHYFSQPAAGVAGLTNIVAVAAGNGHHSVALRADGSIIAWGEDNSFGELDVPVGLSNVVQVSVGAVHNVALQEDGRVAAWGAGETSSIGSGNYGQSIVPVTLTNESAIGAGYYHSLAITGDMAPYIATPLVSRTVLHGRTAWLRIGANGARPLSYQWRFNGQELLGATDALLEIRDVTFEQAGKYSVTVSNAYGGITSQEVELKVAPLFITEHPQSEVMLAGQSVTFSSQAIGQEPLRYQWLFNGADLPGATNSTLVLTNVQPEQEGVYRVRVANDLGEAQSDGAILSLSKVAAWGDNISGQVDVPAGLKDVVALDGGLQFSVALARDGTVRAWGRNLLGETNVPADLTNVTAIAAGNLFTLALQRDGLVRSWGASPAVTTNLTDIAGIAAGDQHYLALKMDGTVTAQGNNSSGQCSVPVDLQNVAAVAAGNTYSLALKSDGTIAQWGTLSSSLPVKLPPPPPPPALTNVIAIAAGREHYVALKADGTVSVRGDDRYAQSTFASALSNILAVAAGEYHSLALRDDGTVLAWGVSASTNSTRPLPGSRQLDFGQAIVPAGVSNISSVAAGGYHSLALVGEGAPFVASPLPDRIVAQGSKAYLYAQVVGAKPLVYQWKRGGVDVTGATNALLVLANFEPGMAGLYSLSVSNKFGLTTTRAVSVKSTPFFISTQPRDQNSSRGGTIWLSVVATGQGPFRYQWFQDGAELTGATNSILTITNAQIGQSGTYSARISNALGSVFSEPANISIGQVIVWGNNEFAQTNLPPGLTNLSAIAAGDYHTLALRRDGTVLAWGQNTVGTTLTGQTNVPAGLSNVVAIAAGWAHSMALKADGTVVSWGNEQEGLRAVPAGLGNVIAIADGNSHSLALKADGTVMAWGSADSGRTRVPSGLSNVVAIAAGGSHSLALRADGTLAAWGATGSTEGRVPPGLSNVVAIAVGFQHSVTLKSDGTVFAWGAGYAGQTNLPPGLTNIIAISAGGHHTLALKGDGTLLSWGDGADPLLPSGFTDLVMFAAGAAHNVVLVGMPLHSDDLLQPIKEMVVVEHSGPSLGFPTLLNQEYFVQYSPDLTGWRTVPLALIGTGGAVSWVDKGMPATRSYPGLEKCRFYRVIRGD